MKNFMKRYRPQLGQYLLECACKSFHGILELECPIKKQTKNIKFLVSCKENIMNQFITASKVQKIHIPERSTWLHLTRITASNP